MREIEIKSKEAKHYEDTINKILALDLDDLKTVKIWLGGFIAHSQSTKKVDS